MLTESSYGWLVVPDPALRKRLEPYVAAAYAARGPSPGLPDGPLDFTALQTHLLAGRYLSNSRPLFTRLPFDYRLVPSTVRSSGLALVDRLHARAATEGFPRWPSEPRLDDLRASLCESAAARAGVSLKAPTYPGSRSGAVLLTHDVDSRGEIPGVRELRDLERRFAVPSSVGFIPRVSWPERSLIEGLIAEGCEVYCHDERHDGKLPYKTVGAIRTFFERFFDESPYAQPHVRGFRSGQLLMTPELLRVLGEWFDYDLSLPDTERGGPYGATAGCATVYPFLVGGLLEIPLTLPQDFYLINVERYGAAQMLSAWRDKLDFVLSRGGVAVVNTHPRWTTRRHPAVWAAYESLLESIARANAWVTTPSRLRGWLLARRDGRDSAGVAVADA